MSDLISRQAALDAIRDMQAFEDDNGQPYLYLYDVMAVFTDEEELPPIQPDNNLQKLADEIASFKRCVKSDNSDYLTGYLCALSAVEGMIADMREVTT